MGYDVATLWCLRCLQTVESKVMRALPDRNLCSRKLLRGSVNIARHLTLDFRASMLATNDLTMHVYRSEQSEDLSG